ETLLHAFLPHRFIDHTHADIALVLTNQPRADAEAMVRDAFGARWAVVPYVMPGFALAKLAAEVFERDPEVEGLVLLNHGLFTFADDARTAYERMIAGVDRAERYVQGRERSRRPVARREAIAGYRAAYDAYFERNRHRARTSVTKLDSSPRVILVPGVGIFATGRTKKDARIAADIAEHTLRAKALANSIGRYTPLPDAD